MAGKIRLKQTATEVFGSDGTRAMTADFDGGTNKITNIGTGTAATDGVTKAQLDAAVAGFDWKSPVDVLNLIGKAAETVIEATSEEGDSYVVSALDGNSILDPGALAIAIGDVVTFKLGVWVQAALNAGGFPPSGFRAIVSGTSPTVPIGPAVANDIQEFDGASLDAATVDTAVNGDAALTKNGADPEENKSAVFDSTPGEWVLFGTGIIPTAGDGLADTAGVRAVVVSDIAGENLEDDGSNNIRIAASAAGAGLTGAGGGGALAVGQGLGMTINANDIAVDPLKLERAGDAEVDGDHLDIDFTPSNYTPDTAPSEAANVDDLAAHLAGIDNELAQSGNRTVELVDPAPVITSAADGTIVVLAVAPLVPAEVNGFFNGVRMAYGASKEFTIAGSTVTLHSNTGEGCESDAADEYVFEYDAAV